MKRTHAADIGLHIGEIVRLAGWRHNVRRLGKIAFLLLRDVSGIAQIVVDSPDDISLLSGMQDESVLDVEGHVVAEKNAPDGHEIHHPRIRVLSKVGTSLHFPLTRLASTSTSIPFSTAARSGSAIR